MTLQDRFRDILHKDASELIVTGQDKGGDDIFTFKGLQNLQRLKMDPRPEAQRILTDWEITRRPDQILARDSNYFALCGRRSGKSFMMMNEADYQCMNKPGFKIAWLGPTFPMITEANIKGDSGFEQLMMLRGGFKVVGGIGRMSCEYDNGSRIVFFSASNPSSIRGTGFNALYADELAFWEHPQDAWNNATTILSQPYAGDLETFIFASTTPPNQGEMGGKSMKAMPLIKNLWSNDKYMNLHFKTADNYFLLPSYLEGMRNDPLKDPRYFSVEFEAEMLDDNPFDLFKKAGKIRKTPEFLAPLLEQIVIAIDPATTSKRSSDNTGIVAAGRFKINGNKYFAILDAYGTRGHVDEWSSKVVDTFKSMKLQYPNTAVHINVETNQGGEAWSYIIATKQPNLKPFLYNESVRGSKEERSLVPSALYEREHICWTADFSDLSKELHEFNPTMVNRQESPGVLDAHNIAILRLVGDPDRRLTITKAKLS